MGDYFKNNWQLILTIIALIIAFIGGVPGVVTIINFFHSPAELSIKPEIMIMGEMDEGPDHFSTVFLTVTITNKGEKPLTPAFFELECKIDRKWIRFQSRLIPEKLQIDSPEAIIEPAKAHKKDLQRFNSPISYVSPVQGFLLFVSDKIQPSDLNKKSNPLRLVCTDILGKKWTQNLNWNIKKITKSEIYPKHGITISPLYKKHPTSDIDYESVINYYRYFLRKLHAQDEVIEYEKNNKISQIVYPEIIEFLVTTTGTVIIHRGYKPTGYPKIEFYSLDVPYQKAIFGENIEMGKPAISIDVKYTVFDYVVFAQRQAMLNYPREIDSIGGYVIYGDRLIDVGQDADVTLLNCYFHFIDKNGYHSLCQEYIYINGSTHSSIISQSAADERIRHLCSNLKNRQP